MSVNTIDTAACVARLFPYSTEITSSKVDEEEEEKEEEEKEKAEETEEKEEEKEEKEYIFCIKDWLQASCIHDMLHNIVLLSINIFGLVVSIFFSCIYLSYRHTI